MPCYHPITAYRGTERTASGKRKLVFDHSRSRDGISLKVPCGQCIGCRLERSRRWALRCVHEAQLYDDNCFITLTYDDKNLPHDGSLDKSHFQKFMKRLRKSTDRKIRYFHCGEYGENFGRPHYHACLFNYDFEDKELWTQQNGINVYVSEKLNSIWQKGFTTVGAVTFESAAYVARYVMKKVTGEMADEYYEKVDPHTGEIFSVLPEYTTMSRRPGIGKAWFEKYEKDCYPSDSVVHKGRVSKPPPYYDALYEIANPEGFAGVKKSRKKEAAKRIRDNTSERLEAREKVKKAQVNMLKRNIK